jgi:cytochrome P450
MTNFATADFYADVSLVDDPHAYFKYLREQGPVARLPHRNVVAITGYDEAIQVMLDTEHFSMVNAVNGPLIDLPFAPEGDDIAAQLEAARPGMVFSDTIVSVDGARHANLRSVIARLFTPVRLKALQPKLLATANALIDEFHSDGHVDLVTQYGGPYATLVISDLLGIPPAGRLKFREILMKPSGLDIGATKESMMKNPLVDLGKIIFGYVARRRAFNHPLLRPFKKMFGVEDDIMTELALAKFPDGTTPKLVDITGLGAFLFGAGQDTTNRLLANAFRIIATRPDIQARLRAEPERIPDFLEEVLRFDGSVKAGGRLCIRTTTVGGVEIKAGTSVLMTHMGANRDPRRFDAPDEFNMDRPRLKEHLAFGRGAHTCIGSALARSEVAVSIERLLARMGNIRLSEAHHGPESARRFDYEPTYVLRALRSLHLEFDPAQAAKNASL